ncbi:type II toxin-antitoxin system VapC family toxin [Mesorhizobium sp. CAU 1732]|uniref:type II toxin-antitoxin system VapC family toxin n=1 Tax=Mesorhizobium sp. CAU 1732 TaxID=3140358 RepID=UPI003260EB55
MFVDASAIIAIIAKEPGWESLFGRMASANTIYVSAISIWEAVRGLHRKADIPLDNTEEMVRHLLTRFRLETVSIDDVIGREALRASRLFGKGHHSAALNMGDCFAYACAKTLDIPLLCKGDDFPRTDITLA